MAKTPVFFKVDFEDGHDSAVQELMKVKQSLEGSLERIVLKASYKLQRAVQLEIEDQDLVDTGFLKANWVSFIRNKTYKTVQGVVATNTHYASYLEYGTVDDETEPVIRARKFMENAWRDNHEDINRYILEEWQKVVLNA